MVRTLKKTARPARAVVAAADDEHALEALSRVVKEKLVSPVLVGDAAKIKDLAASFGLPVNADQIYDAVDVEKAAELAVQLIRDGAGDFLMKGRLETSQLLRAVVNKEKGLGTGSLMSHVAFLEIPAYHKMLVVTDGGMVPHPTLEQKKEICRHAVTMLRSLGYEKPKVGVLAGVEKVNDKMPETLDADELKKMHQAGLIENCVLEGPISLDLALVKEKAVIKGYDSEVAGDVDMLLVPNLCTGNSVSKAFIETGGGKMAGLIAGAKVPIVVTSRASSAEEKYLSLVLASASVIGEEAI